MGGGGAGGGGHGNGSTRLPRERAAVGTRKHPLRGKRLDDVLTMLFIEKEEGRRGAEKKETPRERERE